MFVLFLLFLSSFFFVSAQYYSYSPRGSFTSNLAQGSSGAAEIIANAFGPFFDALLASPPELLFESILIFLIIFFIVFMVVKKIEILRHNKVAVMVISLSVSILAARFMNFEWIYTILLPYQTLGVVLTGFLPLIIGFFFIQSIKSGTIRKMFWIFFIVVFFAMWDMNYYIGPVSWIYFWTALASLIFLVFDGTIRRALIKQKLIEQNIDSNLAFAREIRRELRDLNEDQKHGLVDEDEYKETKRRLTRQLKELAKF